MPWIRVSASSPYFVAEDGAPWTPIGHNEAITWDNLKPLWRRKDVAAVEARLEGMRACGVTVLRVMMEYAQSRHRFFERPVGTFVPAMVQFWDDLIYLCERSGMRLLLTPFDTYWTWRHWRDHPYNKVNGGCLDTPARLLLCPLTRQAIKARLSFAVERWGASGAIFAWDLWNEIHPAQAGDRADVFDDFIADLSSHVRTLEERLFGRARPQTVSIFGPELEWRPHLGMGEPIFRHPQLDFASTHIYAHGTIDDPRDTVAPAVAMGRLVRSAIAETVGLRPFLDSEHGPIHRYKDKRRSLPEAFDDEYFRHLQWAHFASGAAGGGMRWPNRTPHILTKGMHEAQRGLAAFLPEIVWSRFERRPLSLHTSSGEAVAAFGCGDASQAIVWLLRKDTIATGGRLNAQAAPIRVRILVPGMRAAKVDVCAWNTRLGQSVMRTRIDVADAGAEILTPPFVTDLAIAVRAAHVA